MTPIKFSVRLFSKTVPVKLFERVLDLDNWQTFSGFGPIPAIEKAEFENDQGTILGRRIAVTNSDGSTHMEEVRSWEPPEFIEMELKDFSPPLSTLATHFRERWLFEAVAKGTVVVRSFELYPKHWFTRPVLWLTGQFLKHAVEKHTQQIMSD